MSVKAFKNDEGKFVKIASLQSKDIIVDKEDFVSDNVHDALSELKHDFKNLKSNVAWIYENGTIGGGGGGTTTGDKIVVENFDENNNLILNTNQSASVVFKIASKQSTPFNVKIQLNQNVVKSLQVFPNVTTTVSFGQLAQGTHEVAIIASDYTGYPLESWKGYIIKGTIALETNFGSEVNYEMYETFDIDYIVKTASILTGRPITVRYSIDEGEVITIDNVPANQVQYITINPNGEMMSLGRHKVDISATIVYANQEITTNLTIAFSISSNRYIAFYIPEGTSTNYAWGTTVQIPFGVIAASGYSTFVYTANIFKGESATGTPVKTLSGVANSGGTMVISFDTSKSPFVESGEGKYTLTITGHVQDQNVPSINDPVFTVSIDDQLTGFIPWKPEQYISADNAGYLKAWFNARGVSAGEWTKWDNAINSDITCKLFGVNGETAGFITETTASGVYPDLMDKLKLYGESYACIDFKPFSSANRKVTLSFTYKYRYNGDDDATIISCGNYSLSNQELNEGIRVYQQNITTVFAGAVASAPNVEDNWIQLDIVFADEAQSRLIKIYVNGVMCACQETSRNSSMNPDNKIYLGCRQYTKTDPISNELVEVFDHFSDCEFKDIKIYTDSLNSESIVKNYISEQYYMHANQDNSNYDAQRNIDLRRLNSFSDDKVFIHGSNGCNLPIVRVWFSDKDAINQFNNITNNTSGDKSILNTTIPCYIEYISGDGAQVKYNSKEWNTSTIEGRREIVSTTIKLQGTTSLTYNRKNYDISFGYWKNQDGTTGEPVLFTPKYGDSGSGVTREDWLPENTFTLKCDLIDSSHANNVGTATAANKVYDSLNFKTPPMDDPNNVNADKVKFAIDGFPVLLKIADGTGDEPFVNENEPGSFVDYGVYMFDLGRSSHYNMGLKNYDFNLDPAQGLSGCIAVDVEDKIQTVKGDLYHVDNTFAYEGDTNDNTGAGAFHSIEQSSIKAQWTKRFPETASTIGDAAIRNAITVVYNVEHSTNGNAAMDEINNNNYWSKRGCILYMLMAYVFGMIDNLGKNLIVRTWNSDDTHTGTWYPMLYDMDTILGQDNQGEIAYNSNVDLDIYGEDDNTQMISDRSSGTRFFKKSYGTEGDGRGLGRYNTSKSVLWNITRNPDYWFGEFKENTNSFTEGSLRDVYSQLRGVNGILHVDKLWSCYENIIGKIGQIYYNYDAEIKYIPSYTKEVGGESQTTRHNLSMLHGTKELFSKKWLRDRLYYLDSLFEYQNTAITDNMYGYNISMRTNMYDTAHANRVKTRCPIFVKMYSEVSDPQFKTMYSLCTPHYFSEYAYFKENDINKLVQFNNAPLITELNGINDYDLESIDVKKADSLIRLNLSNSKRLKSIDLDNCKSLRYLDLSGCSGLSVGTEVKNSVNLEKCTNLQEVNISDSSLVTMKLPIGGTLKKLIATQSKLSELTVKAQSLLEEIDLTDATDISNIIINNCSNLKKIVLTGSKSLEYFNISGCPSLEEIILTDNNKLTNVNFTDCGNIKKLDLSRSGHDQTAKYTGNADTDFQNALNLSGCYTIEELILDKCPAQVIKFNTDCTTLKKLNASNSGFKQSIFTNASSTSIGTFKGKPAVELGNFNGLENVKFTNNKHIECVTGINYSGPTADMFNQCTNLYRVAGTISTGADPTNMFANIGSQFRLNDISVQATASNPIPAGAELKLNIGSSIYHMFYNNKGITMRDVYYVMYNSTSSLVNSGYAFAYCDNLNNIADGLDNITMANDLFINCPNIVYTNYMFYACSIKGAFPESILNPLSNLEECTAMFASNSFSRVTSNFSSIFGVKSKLTTCASFLEENSSLTSNGQAIDISLFFKETQNLKNCSKFLGFANSSGTVNYPDDIIDARSVRSILLDLSNSERTFARCPKLTDCSNAFACCQTINSLSSNIFGGQFNKSGGKVSGTFTNVTPNLSYDYPVGLQNCAYCFYRCNITMELDDKLFRHLDDLVNCAAFVANSSGKPTQGFNLIANTRGRNHVTGDMGAIKNIFKYNTKLTNVSKFFENTEVSGTIPSGTGTTASALFANNTRLTNISKLFKHSAVSGQIPDLLFGNCTAINNISELYAGCNSLNGQIPDNALKVLDAEGNPVSTGCSTIKGVFFGCSGLSSSIPANLLASVNQALDASCLFMNAGSSSNTGTGIIGAIPVGLLNGMKQLQNICGMFRGCWGITANIQSDNTQLLVEEQMFATNINLTNVSYLFSEMNLFEIPSNVFTQCTKINTVAGMFYRANQTNLTFYANMFDKCKFITDISYFMGCNDNEYIADRTYTKAIPAGGIFKPYSTSSEQGQIGITNVSYAFANLRSATGNAIEFWNWTNASSISNVTYCYRNDTNLSNYSSIPAEYK